MLLFGLRLECRHFWLNVLLERDIDLGEMWRVSHLSLMVLGLWIQVSDLKAQLELLTNISSAWQMAQRLVSPRPHKYRVTPLILRGHSITEILQWLIRRVLGEALSDTSVSVSLGAHYCTRLNLFPGLIISQSPNIWYKILLSHSSNFLFIIHTHPSL